MQMSTTLDALAKFTVEDHIGFLLRRAHQRHVALFTAGVPHAGLTPTQFTALVKTVQLGRITQNHLGRLAAMDPATIQEALADVQARRESGMIDDAEADRLEDELIERLLASEQQSYGSE